MPHALPFDGLYFFGDPWRARAGFPYQQIRDGYAALIKFNVDGISVATDLAGRNIYRSKVAPYSDRSASKLTKLAIEVLLNKVRTVKKWSN